MRFATVAEALRKDLLQCGCGISRHFAVIGLGASGMNAAKQPISGSAGMVKSALIFLSAIVANKSRKNRFPLYKQTLANAYPGKSRHGWT